MHRPPAAGLMRALSGHEGRVRVHFLAGERAPLDHGGGVRGVDDDIVTQVLVHCIHQEVQVLGIRRPPAESVLVLDLQAALVPSRKEQAQGKCLER